MSNLIQELTDLLTKVQELQKHKDLSWGAQDAINGVHDNITDAIAATEVAEEEAHKARNNEYERHIRSMASSERYV